jgi:SanA protein
MKEHTKKRTALKVIIILAIITAAVAAAFFIINSVVINGASKYIYSIDDIDSLPDVDCVLVPGALVYTDKTLSAILQDRVDYAINIYKAGKAEKLLFSGDHGQADYDEVNAMMDYAVSQGVPEENIFLDHAGFSTYESMYRARDVFLVKSVIIVTQQFHISRSVYIARGIGLDAYGVCSNPRIYGNELSDNIRESFARVKDFFNVNIFLPRPTYLGDAIPIFGDSGLTHDKN